MRLYAWTTSEGGVAYGRTIPEGEIYIEVDSLPDAPQEQWSIVNGELVVDEAKHLVALRKQRIQEIKDHGTALCGGRIEVLGDYAMIEFLAELWPVLNNPASNTDLNYVKDVVLFARNRINMAKNADLQTLANYNVATDNWPQ